MHRSIVSTVLSAASLLVAGTALAGALGHLTTQDQVSIETRKGILEINDATYPYAGGERIVTGAAGRAVLTVAGGAITVDGASAAIVNAADGGFEISLESGSLSVKSGAGIGIAITSGGLTTMPKSDGPMDAAIFVDAAGKVTLENRGATLAVSNGEENREVAAGETWSFEPIQPADVAAGEGGFQGARMLKGFGAAAGSIGTAFGANELADDDDDDDDDDEDDDDD